MGGYAPEEAQRVVAAMLPDILPYDPTRPVAYPDNGRLLTDDVVDPLLALLTNGKVTEDGVGPHDDFLAEFPYLGPPQDRKSTRLNSSHANISYAVFCLKKKK